MPRIGEDGRVLPMGAETGGDIALAEADNAARIASVPDDVNAALIHRSQVEINKAAIMTVGAAFVPVGSNHRTVLHFEL